MRRLRGRVLGRLGLQARGDCGASAVEYGLMAALIAAAIAVAVGAFEIAANALFTAPAGL
jgi:Flp pilus assembly pilin Flp